jgi:hypothetical protein
VTTSARALFAFAFATSTAGSKRNIAQSARLCAAAAADFGTEKVKQQKHNHIKQITLL